MRIPSGKKYTPRKKTLKGRWLPWLLWAGAAVVTGLEVAAPYFASLTSPEHGAIMVVVLTAAGFGVRMWAQSRQARDDENG